jgi:hypothetical protein
LTTGIRCSGRRWRSGIRTGSLGLAAGVRCCWQPARISRHCGRQSGQPGEGRQGYICGSGLPIAGGESVRRAVQLVDEPVGVDKLHAVAGSAHLALPVPGVGVHLGLVLEHVVVGG